MLLLCVYRLCSGRTAAAPDSCVPSLINAQTEVGVDCGLPKFEHFFSSFYSGILVDIISAVNGWMARTAELLVSVP